MGHDVRWHDLRHLFAVRCLTANIDISTVSRWLGNSDINLTVKRYGRFAADSHEQWAKIGRIGRPLTTGVPRFACCLLIVAVQQRIPHPTNPRDAVLLIGPRNAEKVPAHRLLKEVVQSVRVRRVLGENSANETLKGQAHERRFAKEKDPILWFAVLDPEVVRAQKLQLTDEFA